MIHYNGVMGPRTAFHSTCQEEVYRQVKGVLDELVEEHFDDAEHCDFYVKFGSTIVEISIEPYEEDSAVVDVLAYCVQGVEPTPELMQEVLRVNAEVPMGAFSLVGRDLYFSHAFLGRELQPSQLLASLEAVAATSDLYDEQIVDRFGGETALARLQSHSRHAARAGNA